MPLYEYECQENGHRFELIRKFSDPPVKKCIKCGAKVERLLSSPAISFKGSGWYVNDYGKGNGASGGSKSTSGGKGDESGASSKPESPKKEGKSSGSDSK